MLCERKSVRGPIAEESDSSPSHERDDDSKTEQKDETDSIRGRMEAVVSRVYGINALGCEP